MTPSIHNVNLKKERVHTVLILTADVLGVYVCYVFLAGQCVKSIYTFNAVTSLCFIPERQGFIVTGSGRQMLTQHNKSVCVHVCFVVLTMPCISQEISDVFEAQIYRSRPRCWEAAGVELELTGELSISERTPGLSHHTPGGRAPWQQNYAGIWNFFSLPFRSAYVKKRS